MAERGVSNGGTIETGVKTKESLLGPIHNLQAVYTAAISKGGLEVIHRRNPAEPKSVMCMDEGLVSPTLSAVRVAGPISYMYAIDDVLTRQVATDVIAVGKVYNHAECGASNLQRLVSEASTDSELTGKMLANRLARNLNGASPTEVTYGGRLELTRRPSGKHTGQIIVFDGRTHGMDPSHIEDFPPAFVISRGIMGSDASREFGSLALDIAMGAHGLGNSLTPDTPIHLVGIADEQKNARFLHDELNLLRSSRGLDEARIQTSVLVGQE